MSTQELTSRLYDVCAELASAERSNADDADRTIDRALSARHHIIDEAESPIAPEVQASTGCELGCGRGGTHPDGLCHDCHEAWHDSLDDDHVASSDHPDSERTD